MMTLLEKTGSSVRISKKRSFACLDSIERDEPYQMALLFIPFACCKVTLGMFRGYFSSRKNQLTSNT